MKFSLGKQEKLKSKKLIQELYKKGDSVKDFPLRMIFLQTQHNSSFPCQVGFSVSKRNFKLAVRRNRIKRVLRETYRLQKDIVYNNLSEPYVFMISYIGKEEIPYDDLYHKMQNLLQLFIEKSNKNLNDEAK